jgi:hypothetical protein
VVIVDIIQNLSPHNYLNMHSLDLLDVRILEEILNGNLRLAVILSESLLRIPRRLLHRFENRFVTKDEPGPERLRPHVFSVGIRKDIDLFFFALQLESLLRRHTFVSNAGLISKAQINLVNDKKSPCSAKGWPGH